VSVLEKAWDELRVGDESMSGARTITAADVVEFGRLTGNAHAQPAREPRCGEDLAQGALLLGCAFGLVAVNDEQVLVLRRLRDVNFARPVRVGDTIRARCRVRELKPINEGSGLVASSLEILNQSDELAMRATVELLWRR